MTNMGVLCLDFCDMSWNRVNLPPKCRLFWATENAGPTFIKGDELYSMDIEFGLKRNEILPPLLFISAHLFLPE